MFKNNEINVFGIGGSPITSGEWSYEWEDTIIEIKNEYNHESSLFNILLTHSPPFASKIDLNLFNQHCGSKRVSNLIKIHKFDLLLCGHIHESQGFDYINGLLCLNAGMVGMRTNQPNLNISNFYLVDISDGKMKIKKYIVGFDSESGYYDYKTKDLIR